MLSRRSGHIVAVAAVLVGLGLVVAAHPVRRVEVFKQPPQQFDPSEPGGLIRAHLLSGNGSGRWEFWTSALDEWQTKPLVGRGAGSYEAWWAQHGTLAYFVKDAHSLYLETLGELGIVGFLLLVGVLLGGIAVGVSRLRRLDDETRVLCASLIAVLSGFGVAAGLDWMWELTAVTVVAVACLALLVGAATLPRPPEPAAVRLGMTATGRRVAIGVVAAAAIVALLSAGDQLIGEMKLDASRSATADRNFTRAFDDALDARDLQPWAATPYLQLALVAERQGLLRTASTAVGEATDRAPEDWRLWLVRARIETKRGMVKAGVQSLRRARSLNPRSPLFVQQ
jgi:O-antigen ligase